MKRPAVLWLLVCAQALVFAGGPDISETIQAQIEEIKKFDAEITEREGLIQKLQKNKHSILAKLDILEHKTAILCKEILLFSKAIQTIKERLSGIQETIGLLDARIAGLAASIRDHYVRIYKYGRSSQIEQLLTSKSVTAFMASVVYSRHMLRFERDLVAGLKHLRTQRQSHVDIYTREISTVRKKQAAKRSLIAGLNREIMEKEKMLHAIDNNVDTNTQYVQELKDSQKELERFIAELKKLPQNEAPNPAEKEPELTASPAPEPAAEKKAAQSPPDAPNSSETPVQDPGPETREIPPEPKPAEKETPKQAKQTLAPAQEEPAETPSAQAKLNRMRFLKSKHFASQKRKLPWPVKGRIVLKYGKIYSRKFNTYYFHNGIDIRVDKGKPVQSVYYGWVVFTGWYKGYGNMVIIDHKQGYYTLYAHLDKVRVAKGDYVNIGQTIATSGDSGSLKGPYLYFEIRRYKKTYNPVYWLKQDG